MSCIISGLLRKLLPTRAARYLLTLAAAAFWVGSANSQTATYKLQADDKVRIKVVEWRASLGDYYEWRPLEGEYHVSPSGDISLPLVGDVRAAGLTAGELSTSISARLQARVGLATPPDAAVEIVQFRPFYILGDVEKPGAYPYRPGMSVLQAVGVAGGMLRPADATAWRFEREAITSRGELRVLSVTKNSLISRRARLIAELQGDNTVAFPPEMLEQGDNSIVNQLMQEEQLIFTARREGLRKQIEGLARQNDLLKKEVSTLNERIATEDRQLKLIQAEVEKVSSLLQKGLTRSANQLTLERAVAQVEGDRLELETARLRAEQAINKTERDMAELQDQRRNEILTDLTQTRAKLAELTEKLATSERMLLDSEVIAPQLQAQAGRDSNGQPIYSLVRNADGNVRETLVPGTALLHPGDVVKVQRFHSETSATAVLGLIGATRSESLPAQALSR